MRCRERSGFLFAHACDQPVVGKCGQCQKPICKRHSRAHESQTLCVSCRKQTGQPSRKTRMGRSYIEDPYFYSHHHMRDYEHYDESHFRAFDQAPGTAPESFEQDWDAS